MNTTEIDRMPGYRRRLRITPASGAACAELEDDFHCMGVRVRHDGVLATQLEPIVMRAPWPTCPGAIEVLKQTFTGTALTDFPSRGEKRTNCTHLHDLAILAARHAFDIAPLTYDVLVSDPHDGCRRAELRRNGVTALQWNLKNGRFTEPAELAGAGLNVMRPWIDSLDPSRQEMARVLRWATMVADGRILSLDGDATRSLVGTGLCYSFQPNRLMQIKRTGEIRDFSAARTPPLETSPLGPPEVPYSPHMQRGIGRRAMP